MLVRVVVVVVGGDRMEGDWRERRRIACRRNHVKGEIGEGTINKEDNVVTHNELYVNKD